MTAGARALAASLAVLLAAFLLGLSLGGFLLSLAPTSESEGIGKQAPQGPVPFCDGGEGAQPEVDSLSLAAARIAQAYSRPDLRIAVVCSVDAKSLGLAADLARRAQGTTPPLLPMIVFAALDDAARTWLAARSLPFVPMQAPSIIHLALAVLTTGSGALLDSVVILHPSALIVRNPLNHILDATQCDLQACLGHADADRLAIFKGLVDEPGEKKMDRGHIPSLVWKKEGNRLSMPGSPVALNLRLAHWRKSSLDFLRGFLASPEAAELATSLDSIDAVHELFNLYLALQVKTAPLGKDAMTIRLLTADRVRYSGCLRIGPLSVHVLPPAFFPLAGHLDLLLPQRFAVQPYVVFPNLTLLKNGQLLGIVAPMMADKNWDD